MATKCWVEEVEGRELDSFDLINVLGLIKESDFKEVWRQYSPGGLPGGRINFFLNTDSYYVEMTVECLPSLALSSKYQASPHLMQALVRRIICGHRHKLLVDKLHFYGVPIADESQLNLSCSVGTVAVDMVANRLSDAPEYRFKKFGTSRVEQDEQRPLDHYDVVSILYLAQWNFTQRVQDRYVPQELLNMGTEEEKVVRFSSKAGNYQVDLFFQRISNDVPRELPQRGNVSTSTMHQALRRIFSNHASDLVARELNEHGIIITSEEASREFSLTRIVNDNYLEMNFKRA